MDAASAMELLQHLLSLAETNRTVVLTIHQPRLDMFYMFDWLTLIIDGSIAYNGEPKKVYEYVTNALINKSSYNEKVMKILNNEDIYENPAGKM